MRAHKKDEASIVRLITCGSVDDGKSTLIGRMLYDSGVLYEDQLRQLEQSRLTGGQLDFSSLLDGLLSEQEQSITIDLAFRSFSTKKRRFLIADAPGHEEYTRNMVTGASQSDLAIVLVDITKAHHSIENSEGLLVQTRRHMSIVSLMGIKHIIVAINKIDAVDFSFQAYKRVKIFCENYARNVGIERIDCVPVSALCGDNVCQKSANTPWYTGKTLLALIEDFEKPALCDDFIFPVQQVTLSSEKTEAGHVQRALGGTVLSGSVSVGQELVIFPSKRKTSIQEIFSFDGQKEKAHEGEAVNLVVSESIDISRGYVLTESEESLGLSDLFAAHIISMDTKDIIVGRTYLCKIGFFEATATILEISAKLNLENQQEERSKVLKNNEIGKIKFSLSRPLPFVPYAKNKDLGSFLFIDPLSAQTIACGMILHDLYRAHSVVRHEFDLTPAMLAEQKNQKAFVLWFSGLSGSGKSTLANALGKALFAEGKHIYQLDGDNLRTGLNRDLGFTEADRVENIRRASHVAKLMCDAGLIVLATFISPFAKDRNNIRSIFTSENFFEIFLDTPIELCEERDPKGLYKKARAGEIPNFTGISSPFERPERPDLHLDGTKALDELCKEVMAFIRSIL